MQQYKAFKTFYVNLVDCAVLVIDYLMAVAAKRPASWNYAVWLYKGAVTVSPYFAVTRCRIHRKIDFAVNVSDEHDVQSHMFRPTITDTQHKMICSKPIHWKPQKRWRGRRPRHLCTLVFKQVNIVTVTTILTLHVNHGRPEHVWLDIIFLAIESSETFTAK